MIMTGKRHDFRIAYRFGSDDAGRLTGVDVDFNARCGCSADLSLGVVDRTMFHADNAYYYPHARIHTRRIRPTPYPTPRFVGSAALRACCSPNA